MTDYADIISRLQAATEPSRELDAHILCATLAPAGAKVEQSKFNGAWCIYEPTVYGKEPFRLWEKPHGFRCDHESVTSSIDTALRLVERVLPGWTGDIGFGRVPVSATIARHRGDLTSGRKNANFSGMRAGKCDLPAISLLIAMFRALQAAEDRG